jgi:hypothetical protein
MGRVNRGAYIFWALLTLGSLWFLDFRVTLGVLAGGGLAVLNFRWMEAGLNAALGGGLMTRRKKAVGVAKFVLRFVLLGVVIYAIVAARIADLKAVLAGLFIFIIAIMWEALRLAFRSVAGSESRSGDPES